MDSTHSAGSLSDAVCHVLQIQMFLEDLTDIVLELKKGDTTNTSIFAPSSS